MEFLSEKAIALWGPFAFCVILLLVLLWILGRQYLLRQEAFEERDQERVKTFTDSVHNFTNTVSNLQRSMDDNTSVTRDMHTILIKMNERL